MIRIASTIIHQQRLGKCSVKAVYRKHGRKETPTVYLAGDSTCADYEAGSPIIGWGTQLKGMLDTQVQNFAVPGRTTKTFLNSGSLEQIIEDAAPGDYLLIQFGHNDSMTDDRHVSLEDYRENLKYFITQARKCFDESDFPYIHSAL